MNQKTRLGSFALVAAMLVGLAVSVPPAEVERAGEFAVAAPAGAAGCALFTGKNIRSALDAVQIACIFESQITDEKQLADACAIAQDLIPILRNLVGQREAAKRSGVSWHRDPVSDAGRE